MTSDKTIRELSAHEMKIISGGQSSVPPAPPITMTINPYPSTPYAPGGASTGMHAPLQHQ
jgi:hypothetical protein